jgi:hypothetical protein
VAKRGGRVALSPRAYARSVSWRVDCDYVGKLAPDEARWLAGFLDRHYGADHRPDESGHDWPVDLRRESYRQKNAANRDLYSAAAAHGLLTNDEILATWTCASGQENWMVKPKKPIDPGDVLEGLAPPVEDNLPEVEWISLSRARTGWVVLRCKTRGRVVIEEEALSQPGAKDHAANTFRVEAARRFILPGVGQ